ncbi:6-pyruvoyl trahydropterin synthase family protein [Sorangium sp. So ce131]|uniref:6-pyruvoyl trahydropterin synthase family protein n=1 Tax=Sorangium sp. So ce131 TaxID=3133282 RepID=UPI003F5DBA5F
MYTVGVRDHIMVAHSLKGEQFGPAQRLHGATYTVSVELDREELSPLGQVIETSVLRDTLRSVLAEIDYRNLDEHPAFEGKRSTPELIARHVHRELGRRLQVGAGTALTITLHESPLVWVRYRAPIRSGSMYPAELA